MNKNNLFGILAIAALIITIFAAPASAQSVTGTLLPESTATRLVFSVSSDGDYVLLQQDNIAAEQLHANAANGRLVFDNMKSGNSAFKLDGVATTSESPLWVSITKDGWFGLNNAKSNSGTSGAQSGGQSYVDTVCGNNKFEGMDVVIDPSASKDMVVLKINGQPCVHVQGNDINDPANTTWTTTYAADANGYVSFDTTQNGRLLSAFEVKFCKSLKSDNPNYTVHDKCWFEPHSPNTPPAQPTTPAPAETTACPACCTTTVCPTGGTTNTLVITGGTNNTLTIIDGSDQKDNTSFTRTGAQTSVLSALRGNDNTATDGSELSTIRLHWPSFLVGNAGMLVLFVFPTAIIIVLLVLLLRRRTT